MNKSFIHSANLYLLIGELNALIFNVIINREILLPLCSLFSLCFVALLFLIFLLLPPLCFVVIIIIVVTCFDFLFISFCVNSRDIFFGYHGDYIKKNLKVLMVYFKLISTWIAYKSSTPLLLCLLPTPTLLLMSQIILYVFWIHQHRFIVTFYAFVFQILYKN